MTSRVIWMALCLAGLSACASLPGKDNTESALNPPVQVSPLEQAQSALSRGDARTALRGFMDLAKTEPDNPHVLLGLGESLLALNNYEVAAAAFEKAKQHPEVVLPAQEGLGLTQLALGNHEQAAALLTAVVADNARQWRALSGLGVLADMRSDYAAAMSWYEKALSAAGAEAVIYNNYGFSRLMARQFAHAEVLLSRALQLGDDSEALRNNLMQAIAWQGDYARAISARGEVPVHVALNNVGYIALLRGDKAVAVRHFQQAIDRSPVWYGLASSNLEMARQQADAKP